MSEQSTLQSFIVRIYRVETDDRRKISGLVEPLDGSGRREPFTDIEELGAALNRGLRRPPQRPRKKDCPATKKRT